MIGKMQTKVVRLLLTIVLIVSMIAGCANESANDNSTSEKKEEKQIVLEFPSWQAEEPGFSDWWKEVIAEYESTHPNVTIDFYQVPFSGYMDAMITRFAAKNPPDIVHIASKFFAQLDRMDWFENLDPYFANTDIEESWLDLQSGVQGSDGSNHGLLLLGNAFSLYYNEKLLAEAGLEVPTTPEEFIEAARKLTVVGAGDEQTTFGFGTTSISNPNFMSQLGIFVVGMGGHYTDSDGNLNLSDPKLKDGLNLFKTLFEEKLVPMGTTQAQVRQYFIEGRVAMMLDGPWVAPILNDAPDDIKPYLKVASTPLPVVAGQMSNSLHIAKDIDAEKQQLVWEFIQLASSKENQLLYAELTNSPPPRSGILTDELLAKMTFMDVFTTDAQNAENIIPKGYEKNYAEFANITTNYIMSFLMGEMTVDEALEKIKSEASNLNE